MTYQRPKIKKWDIIGSVLLFVVLAILYPITKKWQENKIDNYLKNGKTALGFVKDKILHEKGPRSGGKEIKVFYFYVVDNDTVEAYNNIDYEEFNKLDVGQFYEVKYFNNKDGYSSFIFSDKKVPRTDSLIYYKDKNN